MKKQVLVLIGILIIIACGQEQAKKKVPAPKSAKVETATSEVPRPKKKQKIINKKGSKLFILCSACHSLKENEVNKVGPNLYGFMGKKAGIKDDFKYSEALLSSGIVWDEESLRKWIENPAKYIPGTSMAFIGIKEKDRQDALIAYLIDQTQ